MVPRLPQLGAALRFAGVVEDLLSRGGGVDLAAQGRGAARKDLAEVVANGVTFRRAIPLVMGQIDDLSQGIFRFPVFEARGMVGIHGWSSPWQIRACRSSPERRTT